MAVEQLPTPLERLVSDYDEHSGKLNLNLPVYNNAEYTLDETFVLVTKMTISSFLLEWKDQAPIPVTQLDVYVSLRRPNHMPCEIMPFPSTSLLPVEWHNLLLGTWAYCLPDKRKLSDYDLGHAFRFTEQDVANAYLKNNANKIAGVPFYVPQIPPSLYEHFLHRRSQSTVDRFVSELTSLFETDHLVPCLLPPAAPYPDVAADDVIAWVREAKTEEEIWQRYATVALALFTRLTEEQV